jgi:uncharacterized protein (TIGR02722 family)
MKNKILFPILAAVIPLVGAGCASGNAHYIQSGGSESVVSIGQINIQDYMQAADTMTGELLASGALDRVAAPPAVLAISRIVNNTGNQIDTDLLVKKIRVTILNSGKAMTTTTVGLGSTPEDPLAKGYQQTIRNPDFTLSGKIIQLAVSSGNTRQSTYSFQLSLTDTKTGLAVWEGEKDITKQGTRSSVGF